MLLNLKDVQIGRQLNYFKEDTEDLTPMERAHAFNEHEFIRGVHNSFATRLDTLSADHQFHKKYSNAKKAAAKRAKAAETPKKSKAKAIPESPPDPEYDNDSLNHYVAYMHINGSCWKLDGMDPAPQNLGPCTEDDWIFTAAPIIRKRMEEFKEAIEYNLMALVADSLTGEPSEQKEFCESAMMEQMNDAEEQAKVDQDRMDLFPAIQKTLMALEDTDDGDALFQKHAYKKSRR